MSPEFSTSVAVTASGHERRNALWSDARLRFDVGPGIRSEAELGTLIAFFRARRGPARGFRLRDPFDFSSNGMTGVPGPLDQLIGIGDGLAARFQLVKCYGEGDEPQMRPITRPRAGHGVTQRRRRSSVRRLDLSRAAGSCSTPRPPAGAECARGFLFDVPVRFAEDRLDVTGATFAAGEAPSVPLIEVREACMTRVFLAAELEGVATFWRIYRRDGVTLGFTSHDRDLWFDGVLHRAAPGMTPSAIRRTAGLDRDSAEMEGALAHD